MNLIKRNGAAIIITAVLAVVLYVAIVFVMDNMIGRTKLTLGDGVYSAKLATTQSAREKGFGGIDNVANDRALLMAFPSDGLWGIWMKDMKFPIDIVWLDSNKKVVHIEQNVSPESSTDKTYYPRTPARYVVETAAGSVKAKNIKLNKAAIFDVDGLKVE
jgi:uncharacterized membrane protein (UPF0127 family)